MYGMRGILVVSATMLVSACTMPIPANHSDDNPTDTAREQVGLDPSGKVLICHRPDDYLESGIEIEISANALDAHLLHGDTVGACPGSSTEPPLDDNDPDSGDSTNDEESGAAEDPSDSTAEADVPRQGNCLTPQNEEISFSIFGVTTGLSRFNRPDTACAFNGYSDYLVVNGIEYAGNVLSVSLWFKSDNASKYAQTIIGNYLACSYDGTGFHVLLYGDTVPGGARVQVLNSYQRPDPIVDSAGNFADGAWHHMVLILGSTEYYLYIDTQLVGKGSGGYSSNTNPVFVGRTDLAYAGCGNGELSFFDGNMDEILIFDRALSAEDVNKIYYSGGWPAP